MMRRGRALLLPLLLATAALAGCSLQPTGVSDGGEAPTGIASGPTLYFLGADGALEADPRTTQGLGSIAEALALLLAGPGDSQQTDIPDGSISRVGVTVSGDVIELTLPLAAYEVTPTAVDQIVCTAIASHVQHGGSTGAQVRVGLTFGDWDREALRTCPLLAAE